MSRLNVQNIKLINQKEFDKKHHNYSHKYFARQKNR